MGHQQRGRVRDGADGDLVCFDWRAVAILGQAGAAVLAAVGYGPGVRRRVRLGGREGAQVEGGTAAADRGSCRVPDVSSAIPVPRPGGAAR